jgi:erythronate-4-phosphate dehydrogenase
VKIVADEAIPLVLELFSSWGEIVLLPGRQIKAKDVATADILLVRSITPVNQALLQDSQVKFVGSCTAGLDHVDINYLKRAQIAYANAAGFNAEAVAEYVVAVVAALRQIKLLPSHDSTVGIIGVGRVGSRVASRLQNLGYNIIHNDPPRAEQEPDFTSVALTEFNNLDMVCLHTPLIQHGPHPTYHLINRDFLQQLKPGTVILNAGRGAVINTEDLINFGRDFIWCLDVWEQEPYINLTALKLATIATPHIAGYTMQAKLRGTLMIYQEALRQLQLPVQPLSASLAPTSDLAANAQTWEQLILNIYNPLTDTERLKSSLLQLTPEQAGLCFDSLRKHHVQRHEFDAIRLQQTQQLKKSDLEILKQLGFRI